MLVHTPAVGWPPHDHGATYRSHYNGHAVVRANIKPHALRSDARQKWLETFAAVTRLYPAVTAKPPFAHPYEWARVALPPAATGATFAAPPPWVALGQPYPVVLTFTATVAQATLAWSAGVVLGGAWHLHFCLRPSYAYLSYPLRSHYTVRGIEPFPNGAKAAGSMVVDAPPNWFHGVTVRARVYLTKGDGKAYAPSSPTTVVV